jgi:hypothetical protein
METRANYVLIGVFTLAVIAGGFLFVMWFTGLGKSAQHKTYEVVFTGSVSGLSRGSLVTFNGLRVGEVRSIGFFPNDPTRVAAMIDVTENAPVKSDTQARLESQGLTGVATLALTGESSSSPALQPGPGGAPPIIDAERSDFQNLLETVQRISGKADAALTKANKLIDDNSPAVSDALHNVDQFSKALAENSAGVKTFLASVSDLGQKLAPLSDKLQTLSSDVDVVVKAVDPAKVKDFIANVDDFSAALARNKAMSTAFLPTPPGSPNGSMGRRRSWTMRSIRSPTSPRLSIAARSPAPSTTSRPSRRRSSRTAATSIGCSRTLRNWRRSSTIPPIRSTASCMDCKVSSDRPKPRARSANLATPPGRCACSPTISTRAPRRYPSV